MRIVIVTGLSGAGKSTALRALEDLAFTCVDNMPLPLLPTLVELYVEQGVSHDLAVSIDSRQSAFLGGYGEVLKRLRASGHDVETLFLEAPDDLIVRRYSETRRRHPLSGDNLREGIERDRRALKELRGHAAILDTGRLNVHQLKGIIEERYGLREGHLAVTLLSFGFKHGLPHEADMVLDVRFLPNPYFEPTLSARDGRDKPVSDFVLGDGEGKEVLERIEQLLRFTLPKFEREKKFYVTVAIGCTGGRHRSVAMVEALGARLEDKWAIRRRHRDLGS